MLVKIRYTEIESRNHLLNRSSTSMKISFPQRNVYVELRNSLVDRDLVFIEEGLRRVKKQSGSQVISP